MKKALFALSLTGFTVAAIAALAQNADHSGAGAAMTGGPASVASRASVNAGRFVALGGEYGNLRFVCASCHGAEGQGDPSGAFPRLSGQSAWYLFTSLQDFASGARPSQVMGPIAAELSFDEMMDVAAYFSSRDDVPYPPSLQTDEPLIEEGGKIVAEGLPKMNVPACSTCHGAKGLGGGPVYPVLAGQYEPYLKEQLRLFRSDRRGGDPLNVMHEIAEKLTNQQINAVAAYFASLSPEETNTSEKPSEAAARPPRPLPMQTGAVIDIQPAKDKTVVPGTSNGQGEKK